MFLALFLYIFIQSSMGFAVVPWRGDWKRRYHGISTQKTSSRRQKSTRIIYRNIYILCIYIYVYIYDYICTYIYILCMYIYTHIYTYLMLLMSNNLVYCFEWHYLPSWCLYFILGLFLLCDVHCFRITSLNI